MIFTYMTIQNPICSPVAALPNLGCLLTVRRLSLHPHLRAKRIQLSQNKHIQLEERLRDRRQRGKKQEGEEKES